MHLDSKALARYWAKVQKAGPDECWLWSGSTGKGYGQFWLDGRLRKATHIAFWLSRGEEPDGLFVLHSCDNPPCVNPDHLFLGTNAENMADMRSKGRSKGGRSFGYKVPDAQIRRGVTHSRARFTEADITEMRAAVESGETRRSIALRYGVHRTTVERMLRGVTYGA